MCECLWGLCGDEGWEIPVEISHLVSFPLPFSVIVPRSSLLFFVTHWISKTPFTRNTTVTLVYDPEQPKINLPTQQKQDQISIPWCSSNSICLYPYILEQNQKHEQSKQYAFSRNHCNLKFIWITGYRFKKIHY